MAESALAGTVLGDILAVFSGIASWFVEIIPIVISLFYTTVGGVGSLTFLGYLAIIGLGISIIFLMNFVTRISNNTRITSLIARNSLGDNLQPRQDFLVRFNDYRKYNSVQIAL